MGEVPGLLTEKGKERAVDVATPKRSATQDSVEVPPSSRNDCERSTSPRCTAISPSMAALERNELFQALGALLVRHCGRRADHVGAGTGVRRGRGHWRENGLGPSHTMVDVNEGLTVS